MKFVKWSTLSDRHHAGKQAVGHVIDVVRHSVRRIEGMSSYAVDRVRMRPITHINETNGMADGLVCVVLRFQVPIRRPEVTDDCSSGFDPVTKNSH